MSVAATGQTETQPFGLEDGSRVESQCTALRPSRVLKLRRGHEDAWQSTAFQLGHVVHTARRAGPSISEGFDDCVALDADLIAQIHWCRLRERRLAEAKDLNAAPRQQLLQSVQEDVTPRLRDVEETDRKPLERARPGDPLPGGRPALAR